MSARSQRIRQIFRYVLLGRCDHLRYALWVRAKGLDFSPVSVERLGLSNERAKHHAASGGVFLGDVLSEMDIPPGSRIIDLGCGKGSAMCTLARFPFDEVAGVELSAPMARIAQANWQKLGLKDLHVYIAN